MPAGMQHEPRHRLPIREPDRGGDGADPPGGRPRSAAGGELPEEPPAPWSQEDPGQAVESEAPASAGPSSLRA